MAMTKDEKARLLAEVQKIESLYYGPAVYRDGPVKASVLQLEGAKQLLALIARILLAM